MKVSDIMTSDVISVKKETSLKEAAGLLAKFRVHGLPVVDEENKVLGIIAESDFFTKDESNIFLPTFLEYVKKTGENMPENMNTKEIENVNKVEDIMTKDCYTIPPDLQIEELIKIIQVENYNSFPVVDGNKKLLGIVTIMDVIKLL